MFSLAGFKGHRPFGLPLVLEKFPYILIKGVIVPQALFKKLPIPWSLFRLK